MRQILLLTLGTIIYSCITPDKKELFALEGEWFHIPDKDEISINYQGIKFERDTFYTIANDGLTQIGKYVVTNDTIIVEDYDVDNLIYKIVQYDKDNLTLFYEGQTDKYYNRRLEYDNKLTFDKIILRAGNCFGDCAEFEVIIEKGKDLSNFNGLRNCKHIGQKEIKFSNSELYKIDSLFKWTNITKLDTAEFYGAEDDWGITIKIEFDKDKSKTIKGTYGYMSYRVKRIMEILIKRVRKEGLI